MEKFIIEIIIEVILFLSISYLLYYKSFLKEIGKQNAQIITRQELIEIEENVKQEFRLELANLRSEMSKNNISYQIGLAELTKMRFIKVEDFILKLITLQDYITENMFWVDEENYELNKKEFRSHYKKADRSRKVCSLYLPDNLITNIIDVMNNTHEAYISFIKIYHTNPDKFGDIPIWNNTAQNLKNKLSNENFQAYEKLNEKINGFPLILKKLSDELKNTIIFKNIDAT